MQKQTNNQPMKIMHVIVLKLSQQTIKDEKIEIGCHKLHLVIHISEKLTIIIKI